MERLGAPGARLPELVLSDIQMPGIDGVELCRQLKANAQTAEIPVILFTGVDDDDTIDAAFIAGAADYLAKPPRRSELTARLRSALTLKAALDRRREREQDLVRIAGKLEAANEKLRQLSMIDGLTGIANRRMFDETLDREWKRCQRADQWIGLLMADIDDFKAYNDNCGHLQGDLCLKAVAAAIEYALKRPSDFAARYGGEEMVVLLPETDKEGALQVAQSVQASIAALNLSHPASRVSDKITVSIGVAAFRPDSELVSTHLINAADGALYAAKAEGRDRICVADTSETSI